MSKQFKDYLFIFIVHFGFTLIFILFSLEMLVFILF